MANRVKKLAILGSTGSIGQQTLDVVRKFSNRFKIVGLACGANIALFKQQLQEFRPLFANCSADLQLPVEIKRLSLKEMACHADIDIVVVATTGKAGLDPTISALRAGKTIAIANKEILVMAGKIIQDLASKHSATILPIDSEHCAIWQCLQGEKQAVSRIILTASGGPFFGWPKKRLAGVTVNDALNHPTWKMGKKVTIDSATLFNKGLEVMEAHWLFSVPYEKIMIIIHRQSIIHSMVEFTDGSIKAQLSTPDMHLPIQYALLYPERINNKSIKPLNLDQLLPLTLEPVKYDDFPCLKLALDAAKKGGSLPSVLCAADEVAIDLFIKGEIGFLQIPEIIGETMSKHNLISQPTLDDIIAADKWGRRTALQLARKYT